MRRARGCVFQMQIHCQRPSRSICTPVATGVPATPALACRKSLPKALPRSITFCRHASAPSPHCRHQKRTHERTFSSGALWTVLVVLTSCSCIPLVGLPHSNA